MTQLALLRREQALAWAGSAGHGAFRALHCINAASGMSTPETPKTMAFCSDIAVIHGTVPTIPTKVAPMPSVTNKAGNAQHSKVPRDVKSESDGRTVCRHNDGSLFTMSDLHYIVTGICD